MRLIRRPQPTPDPAIPASDPFSERTPEQIEARRLKRLQAISRQTWSPHTYAAGHITPPARWTYYG